MKFRALGLLCAFIIVFCAGCVQDEDFLLLQNDVTKMENRVKQIESKSLKQAETQISSLQQSQRSHGGALDQSLARLSNIEKNLDTILRQQQSLMTRMDRIEKSQLQQNKQVESDIATLKKDQAKSLATTAEKLRIEFNSSQKNLGAAVDQKFATYSKNIDAKVDKLSREISSFYSELERTIQSYSSGTYVVKSGETLSKIAQDLGVSVEDLCRVNNLKDPSKIFVGQELVLP